LNIGTDVVVLISVVLFTAELELNSASTSAGEDPNLMTAGSWAETVVVNERSIDNALTLSFHIVMAFPSWSTAGASHQRWLDIVENA
jgi:hypothetical protein